MGGTATGAAICQNICTAAAPATILGAAVELPDIY
jgi:hypothetical protein